MCELISHKPRHQINDGEESLTMPLVLCLYCLGKEEQGFNLRIDINFIDLDTKLS
ncbi:hypothetical protein [Helicobacter marmotae]|uniref:hypothetical protein n=1 Tax=Helicobacter marmotae TaxID=152490 RepID=UPI0014758D9F|nr:hypothetical protein [Helicobacter marmotae]